MFSFEKVLIPATFCHGPPSIGHGLSRCAPMMTAPRHTAHGTASARTLIPFPSFSEANMSLPTRSESRPGTSSTGLSAGTLAVLSDADGNTACDVALDSDTERDGLPVNDHGQGRHERGPVRERHPKRVRTNDTPRPRGETPSLSIVSVLRGTASLLGGLAGWGVAGGVVRGLKQPIRTWGG